MNYLQLFRSALTALRSNIMRTALTMLGIIIGISSVILITTLAQGATSSITSQISSLGTNLIFIVPGTQSRGPVQGTGNIKTLTYTDAQAIAKLPHVTETSAVVTTRAQVIANGQNTNISISGVQEAYQALQSITMEHGSFIEQSDEDSLSRVAVLGPQVVTDLFGEGADPTGQSIQIGSKFFRVVGVTQAKGGSGFSNPDDTVYVPVTTAMTILLGQNYVSVIEANTDDPNQVTTVNDAIKELLINRHNIAEGQLPDFTTQSSQSALDTVNTITGLLTAMLAGIAGISLVVGGIGIMNIMLVTVTERTKEIGLLKAIGAKRKDILTQFLIEAVVLTLSGGAVGIVVGLSLGYVVAQIIHIPYIVSLSSIALAVGVSTTVGVIFGIYPAQRAAKLSPIDALRYE
jgi:putative ABC transport system permease protein